MLVCTLKTYQSKTCDFHFKSSCCSWSAIFSPECLEGARVGKSVLRFQCSVNAHPPWAHKPAYTRVTHRAQCSEIPRFLVGEFLVNWATELKEKVVKRKVIIPSPLWWSRLHQQPRDSGSAPRANHKAEDFGRCILSSYPFSSPQAMLFVFAVSPVTHLGKAHTCFYKNRVNHSDFKRGRLVTQTESPCLDHGSLRLSFNTPLRS